MNTPAHAVLSLVALGGGDRRRYTGPILAGAIAPDVPMFLFFLWERFVQRETDARLWGELYFAPHWQDFFDVANSLPLIAIAFLAALWLRRPAWKWGFASMALHAAMDLPLHREDAHRHFFPLSDWRFVSPVSYWDPANYGRIAAGVEVVLVVGASALLWRRYEGRIARTILVGVSALYLVLYSGFYLSS